MKLVVVFALVALPGCFAVMTGGWKEYEVPNAPENRKALKGVFVKIAEHLQQRENSICAGMKNDPDVPGEVLKLRSQVVAGIKWEVTQKIGHKGYECAENGKCACKVKKYHQCKYTVVEQAWMPEPIRVLGFKCREEGNEKTSEDAKMSDMFRDFVKKHNKKYTSAREEEKRLAIFRENMAAVETIQKRDRGTAKYGATEFADMTQDEFAKTHLMPLKFFESFDRKEMKEAHIPYGDIPDSFDWRRLGAVTAVKNQGSCGSCWAFSTTGNIEGQWKNKRGSLVSLSEQELVDCDKVDQGCDGGLPSNAYKQIIKLGGLETEKDYSYKGDDEKCEFQKKKVRVYINSSVVISTDEKEMAAWLVKNGPISIGINAFAMQFYFGGISHPWSIFCSPSSLDHGVLIVGYGVENSTPFWIIKNSWGPSWGEKGYYRVYRGGGVCGLNRMCTSAIIE